MSLEYFFVTWDANNRQARQLKAFEHLRLNFVPRRLPLAQTVFWDENPNPEDEHQGPLSYKLQKIQRLRPKMGQDRIN